MEEISKPLEVGIWVRQGDGLSPLLFNCVLEKVVRELRKCAREKGIQWTYSDRNQDNLEIDCLAFVDDQAIFTKDIDNAIELINILNKVTEKTRLQIFL